MRASRCLVLPSFREHWGLVVHEAALAGCALILSDQIGSARDLACPENALIFPAENIPLLVQAFEDIAAWGDDRWRKAEDASRKLAGKFGPEIFAASVTAILDHVAKGTP